MNITQEYFDKGYYLFENVFNKELIQNVLKDIQDLHRRQFVYLGLDESSIGFDACLTKMFNMDLNRYIHANRTSTMLSSVYNLAYDKSIINSLLKIGIKNPILCQKPTLRMDCQKMAISSEYYKLPAHQDYKSMQGSINSVVVSIPLVDANESLGALMVSPGSHKIGFLKSKSSIDNKSNLDALKAVEIETSEEFITIPQKQGDALIISSFLLHRSGTNVLETPRYTLLIRFNDLEDKHFLDNGFISPFKTIHESVVDDSLDYKKLLNDYFNYE